MKILSASFENYRNLAATSIHPQGQPVFLEGSNGQGKSNILEAIGLITAFRSFRTSDLRHLIRIGTEQARLCIHLKMDNGVTLRTDLVANRDNGKGVSVEGHQLPTLQDFIGRFPTVTFSEDDIQILRGAPSLRRRAMDLFFSSLDPEYLDALRRYHVALRDRNAQIKSRPMTPLLRPFEREMARHGSLVLQRRRDYCAAFGERFAARYSAIAGRRDESPGFHFAPSLQVDDEDEFSRALDAQRDRDIQNQTTRSGPHRDDYAFRLFGQLARDFASDGQQRNLVLAFRLAQFDLIHQRRSENPVILADDILGSLDPVRREAFWDAIGPDCQIIATGTSEPVEARFNWTRYRIEDGNATATEA